MSKIMLTALSAAALLVCAQSAQAFPGLPSTARGDAPAVVLVSGGCGPNAHRGPDDECHRNRGPMGFGIPGFGEPRREGFGRREGFDRPDGGRRFDADRGRMRGQEREGDRRPARREPQQQDD